ncbi:Adenosine kinase 2 [Acorus calamus]|uniref:Adenosine kinase n=1 Tax=Acorus calamus TaxID=4465 RepID=A0AAV9E7M6_ACOCL|nr:Adenosine kinase 2 [Acorus calamus]
MGAKYNVEYIAGGATQNSIKVAQVHYYEDETDATGTCVGCVVDSESLGITTKLRGCPRVISSFLYVILAKYYYIAGFFLTVSPESIQLVAEHAAANNKIFMMNLSAPFICEFFQDALEKVLPYMDFVFGNETEARTFSKVHGWETENVEEIALKISEWPKVSARKRITVITQGADPVVVAEDGKVKLFPVILLPRRSLLTPTEQAIIVLKRSLSKCLLSMTI